MESSLNISAALRKVGLMAFFTQLRSGIHSVAHLLRTGLTAYERARPRNVTDRIIKCIPTQI